MKRAARLILAALLATGTALHGAAPANVRVTGSVTQAGSGGSVRFAQVRIEGAALAGRENNQIIQKVGTDGRYRLDVPPGAYELWASAPDHEEILRRVDLKAGEALTADFALPALQPSPYRVETVALPRQMVGELSGVAFTPGGTLVVHINETPVKCPVAPLEFAFFADDFLRRRGVRVGVGRQEPRDGELAPLGVCPGRLERLADRQQEVPPLAASSELARRVSGAEPDLLAVAERRLLGR